MSPGRAGRGPAAVRAMVVIVVGWWWDGFGAMVGSEFADHGGKGGRECDGRFPGEVILHLGGVDGSASVVPGALPLRTDE